MTSEALARPAVADLAGGSWRVVPLASTATFSVRDKVLLTVRGTLPIHSGTAVLGLAGGLREARVELDAQTIETGNARRDRDLGRPGLLNYTTYPSIVVASGPAAPGPHGWDLTGTVSAAGVDCPISLRVVPEGRTQEGVTVHVTGRFDRKGLRMRVPRFVIGRWVDIEVDLLLRPEA